MAAGCGLPICRAPTASPERCTPAWCGSTVTSGYPPTSRRSTMTKSTSPSPMLDVPESAYDPYTDEALLDPWAGYRQLRDAGPTVWLRQYGMFAMTRHFAVR